MQIFYQEYWRNTNVDTCNNFQSIILWQYTSNWFVLFVIQFYQVCYYISPPASNVERKSYIEPEMPSKSLPANIFDVHPSTLILNEYPFITTKQTYFLIKSQQQQQQHTRKERTGAPVSFVKSRHLPSASDTINCARVERHTTLFTLQLRYVLFPSLSYPTLFEHLAEDETTLMDMRSKNFRNVLLFAARLPRLNFKWATLSATFAFMCFNVRKDLFDSHVLLIKYLKVTVH